jgi:hypothetical protein
VVEPQTPITDATEHVEVTESEFPDLLKAAKDLLAAIDALPEGLEGYLASLDVPVASLRAAVDFNEEFSN